MSVQRIATIAFFSIVVLFLIYGMGYLIWFGENTYKGADFSIVLTEILLGIAILATIVTSIANLFHHPKSAISSLIGVVALALIGFIGYTVSPGEIMDKYIDFGVTEASQSKWVDAGLYLMYGTVGIALIAILVAEVNSLLKN